MSKVDGGQPKAVRRASFINVPNCISALRLPIAAAFFVIDALTWRGVLLLIGAISDALDGWVARRMGLETKTGTYIDPLFDKLFVTVILAAFLSGPYLGWREFIVLVSRDIHVGIGFFTARLMSVKVVVHPRVSGKLVTFLQLMTLFVLLLVPEQAILLIVAVGLASAIAIVDYTSVGIVGLRDSSGAVGAGAQSPS